MFNLQELTFLTRESLGKSCVPYFLEKFFKGLEFSGLYASMADFYVIIIYC